MAIERKKVKLKEIPKVEPKKREKPMPELNPISEPETVQEQKKPRAKPSQNKYIRLALDAKIEERKEFSDKVKNGELSLAYYATDGDKGYHYYLVINK